LRLLERFRLVQTAAPFCLEECHQLKRIVIGDGPHAHHPRIRAGSRIAAGTYMELRQKMKKLPTSLASVGLI